MLGTNQWGDDLFTGLIYGSRTTLFIAFTAAVTSTVIGTIVGLLSGYYGGIIDEVFVFNRALSAEEISDLYNNYGYTTINYPGRVLIRKYVSPEPTFSSAGSEETSFSCTDIIGLQDSSSRSGPIVGSCTDILDSTSSSSLLNFCFYTISYLFS